MFQDIAELNLNDYRNGGLNITGFQLIDFSEKTTKTFLDGWNLRSTDGHPVTTSKNIGVGEIILIVCTSISIPYIVKVTLNCYTCIYK